MMSKKKESYGSLQRSLRCANEEVANYLQTVGGLRTELDSLKQVQVRLNRAEFLVTVLMQALYEAQHTPRTETLARVDV